MGTTRVALIATLMLTAALAGCMSDDTSDLDARISELEQSNMEMNESLITTQGENDSRAPSIRLFRTTPICRCCSPKQK